MNEWTVKFPPIRLSARSKLRGYALDLVCRIRGHRIRPYNEIESAATASHATATICSRCGVWAIHFKSIALDGLVDRG